METRAGKYGRNLAIFVSSFIDSVPDSYRKKFLTEMQTYCLEPRKKGEPPNKGCVNELENIANVDLGNPKHLARLIKEGIHLMYQKQTAKRVLYSFLENLER